MLSALQFNNIKINKVDMEINPEYDEKFKEEGLYDILCNVGVSQKEDKNAVKIILGITLNAHDENKKGCPYNKLHINLIGLFTVHPNSKVDKETMATVIPDNCVAMLYSTARGILLSHTSIYGQTFILPAVDIREVMKPYHEKMKEKQTTEKAQKEQ